MDHVFQARTCAKCEGEYTALCAAGVMSFEDGLKLVKLRGEAMQEAATSLTRYDSWLARRCAVLGILWDLKIFLESSDYLSILSILSLLQGLGARSS